MGITLIIICDNNKERLINIVIKINKMQHLGLALIYTSKESIRNMGNKNGSNF